MTDNLKGVIWLIALVILGAGIYRHSHKSKSSNKPDTEKKTQELLVSKPGIYEFKKDAKGELKLEFITNGRQFDAHTFGECVTIEVNPGTPQEHGPYEDCPKYNNKGERIDRRMSLGLASQITHYTVYGSREGQRYQFAWKEYAY